MTRSILAACAFAAFALAPIAAPAHADENGGNSHRRISGDMTFIGRQGGSLGNVTFLSSPATPASPPSAAYALDDSPAISVALSALPPKHGDIMVRVTLTSRSPAPVSFWVSWPSTIADFTVTTGKDGFAQPTWTQQLIDAAMAQRASSGFSSGSGMNIGVLPGKTATVDIDISALYAIPAIGPAVIAARMWTPTVMATVVPPTAWNSIYLWRHRLFGEWGPRKVIPEPKVDIYRGKWITSNPLIVGTDDLRGSHWLRRRFTVDGLRRL